MMLRWLRVVLQVGCAAIIFEGPAGANGSEAGKVEFEAHLLGLSWQQC